MRILLLLLASAMIACAAPTYEELRLQARAAEKEGRLAQAADLFEQGAEAALAVNQQTSAHSLLAAAAMKALRSGAFDRSVTISRRAIKLADTIMPGLNGPERKSIHVSRISCRVGLEFALFSMDRFAQGYAENRALWLDIEAFRVQEDGAAPGDPRQAADLARWEPELRKFVWAAAARESLYLDIMGRTLDAVALLQRTSAQVSALGRLGDAESTYAPQIRTLLAARLQFLGHQRESLDVRRAALSDPNVRFPVPMYWAARLNYIYSLGNYEGPSREKLDEAGECLREIAKLSSSGPDANSLLMAGEMRAEYDEVFDAQGNRRPATIGTPKDGKPFLEHRRRPLANALPPDLKPTSVRNSPGFLVDAPPKAPAAGEFIGTDKPGLDGEFVRLLNDMRKRGNKRDEPGLYQEYANYLRRLDRPAEALPLYREALRLTESFGWSLHVPAIRLAIIGALYDLHDYAGADAEWAVMERQVAAIPNVPALYLVNTLLAHAEWHRLRGDMTKARAALAQARILADARKLNAWERRGVETMSLDGPAITAAPQPAAPAATPAARAPVSLQPSRIVTGAAAGDPLRARFVLRNPDGRARTGEFRARGSAVQLGLETTPRRITGSVAAAGAEKESRLPMVLAPGEELGVVLEVKGGPAAGKKAAVQVAWHEGPARTVADWHITTEHDPFAVSVVNASQMRLNAFHSVSFTQQIVRRAAGPGLVNFRFIASAPLRLEYYDAATHRLLAVDANGNGDFTAPGDSLLSDKDGNLAPDVEFDGKEKMREIEVSVFSTATAPPAGKLIIEAELLTEKGWEKVARNELE